MRDDIVMTSLVHVPLPPLEDDLKCVMFNLTFIHMTIKVIVHEQIWSNKDNLIPTKRFQ